MYTSGYYKKTSSLLTIRLNVIVTYRRISMNAFHLWCKSTYLPSVSQSILYICKYKLFKRLIVTDQTCGHFTLVAHCSYKFWWKLRQVSFIALTSVCFLSVSVVVTELRGNKILNSIEWHVRAQVIESFIVLSLYSKHV